MENKPSIWKKEIGKDTVIKIVFFIAVLLFAVPSFLFIVQRQQLINGSTQFSFFYNIPKSNLEKQISAIVFVTGLICITIFYLLILKRHRTIFLSKKGMGIFIGGIALIFMIMVPITSTDVYYYMGTGWIEAKYNENPYYTSIQDVMDSGQTDSILEETPQIWRTTKVVYGPLWPFICKILAGLSFGNINIALLLFKFLNLIIHLACCFLIYKLTKRKFFVLLYGLNPLVLLEALTNVHNDIFIIFFLLLAFYFLLKKKKIIPALAFIACATAIKYFTLLLVPFILLYYVRNEKWKDKIITCIQLGLLYIAMTLAFYLLYIQDFSIFTGIMVQQDKHAKSLQMCLLILAKKYDFVEQLRQINLVVMGILAIMGIKMCIDLFMDSPKTIHTYLRKYNTFLMAFLFLYITNFQQWYLIWLFGIIFWQRAKTIRKMLVFSIVSQLCLVIYFWKFSEAYILGVPYILSLLIGGTILAFIWNRIAKKRKAIVKVK